MNRHETMLKAADAFADVIRANTRPGRTQDAALELTRKALQRANTAVIVDKLQPKPEENS